MLFFPDLASNLKHNDLWLQKPSGNPLSLVLSMAINGTVNGDQAHESLSLTQIDAAYNYISKTTLKCTVTDVSLERYSGTGLNKLSPDRLLSNLPVDHPQRVIFLSKVRAV